MRGRLAIGLIVCTQWATVGCNQNGVNRWQSPWGSPNTAAPGALGANSANPSLSPVGPLRRWGFLSDLQRRADEQTRLAEEQRQRLAQLHELQRMNEDQLLALRTGQMQSLAENERQRQLRQQELAARARDALGRYDELDRRAQGLDNSNRDLNTQIARMQQRNQILEDQNRLLQQQLGEASQRLASAVQSGHDSEQRLQTMMASARRRSGASLTANNSFRQNLTAVSVPGLSIRQDGELVRIELPSDALFEYGTARLRPEGTPLLDQAADVVMKHYGRQVVGVEAHADNMPTAGTMWHSTHQLTAAQAMAVFEQLTYRQRLLPQQLFVLGHGENYPLASNATAAGQTRNRRVELVVYPEVVGQRSP